MNANNGGDYGLYISNNGGQANTYQAEKDTNIVHAYREIYMPESDSYELTFDWKAAGAPNDHLNVYLIPADHAVCRSVANEIYK
jgi:hypothetical protein